MGNWWENDPIVPTPSASDIATPPVTLPTIGAMPPGTVPGRMGAQAGSPDVSMVPLSGSAVLAQKLMRVNGLIGDRAGVQSENDILQADPTYQERKAQVAQMGQDAGKLSNKMQAGTRVLDAVNQLEQKAKAWSDHAPGAFAAGIGPWQSGETYQSVVGSLPFSNHGAQAFTTSMHHDIDKLVALYREMPSTGASSGSDAQDANFKEAMGKWIQAPDADTAFAILDSAKDLVRQKSGLPATFDVPKKPLGVDDIKAINHYAGTWWGGGKPIDDSSPYWNPALNKSGKQTVSAPQPNATPEIDPTTVPVGQVFPWKGHQIKALGNGRFQRVQ